MTSKPFIRVEWRFYWHGFNYCRQDVKDMREARSLIKELRVEGEKTRLRPSQIRVVKGMIYEYDGLTRKETKAE